MSVEKVLKCERVTSELGEEGLRDLLASVWVVDCQTCGKFLGEDPPALCVDDSVIYATASLHHPDCRASQWNDSGVLMYSGIEAITWNAAAGILVLDHAGKPDPKPALTPDVRRPHEEAPRCGSCLTRTSNSGDPGSGLRFWATLRQPHLA